MTKTARLTLALSFVTFSAVGGPIGYLFNGDGQIGFQVDLGTGAASSFTTYSLGYPVAIENGTIRLGHRDDATGHEYTLAGVDTGFSFTGGGNFTQLLDGTTNGINNFGVECCGGTNSVTTADPFWQGMTALFNLSNGGSGIAYDTSAGTLWVSLFDGTVHQFTLAGVDLGSFASTTGVRGLAFDSGTNTLWAFENDNLLYNYSTSGAVLGTLNVPLISGQNIFGFEIDNNINAAGVPEPGTIALMGAGLAMLGLAGRLRRR